MPGSRRSDPRTQEAEAPPRPAASALPAFTVDEILQGIKANQFYLAGQAQVDLETLDIVGFECLARWQHPDFGDVFPFHFIPVLEEAQQCHFLTIHLFNRMLGLIERLQQRSPDLHFSLNISAHDLCRKGFADEIINIARSHTVEPTSVVLEVTETAGIFGETSVTNLRQLHAFGIQLAVDDFWTGFSTLETIRLNIFSEIKIDFSLTSRVINDKTSMAGINAILQLSSNLGLRCIVEGIETCMVRSILLEAGAKYGQGFLFSKGVKDEQLEEWIQKYHSHKPQKSCTKQTTLYQMAELEELETRPHPSWLWDFTAKKIVWANPSGCQFWQADSTDELQARDFSSMSYLAKTRLKSYQLRMQAGENIITSEWDFFPGRDAQKVFCIQLPRINPLTGELFMLVNAFEDFNSRLPARKYIDSSDEFPAPFIIADEDGNLLRINKHAHIEIKIEHDLITDLISEEDFSAIKAHCSTGQMVHTFAAFNKLDGYQYLYIRATMLPDMGQNGRNVFHMLAIPVADTLTRDLPEPLNEVQFITGNNQTAPEPET